MKTNWFILVIFTIFFFCNCSSNVPEKGESARKPYAALKDLPFGSIKPEGWMLQNLELQRNGLTGHLEEGKFPFNTDGWIKPRFDNLNSDAWWPYEQMAYWVDGMTRCGYLLNDTFLISKANRQLGFVLAHPDSSGYLGPNLGSKQKMFRWPHAVLFRAYQAEYDATGNKEIIEKLKKHYLGNPYLHIELREAVNIESILYLYEKTADTALLNLAVKIYDVWGPMHKDCDASPVGMMKEGKLWEHGVTFNELAKLGAILYLYTGEKKYLEPSINAYKRVEKSYMLADGMHIATEGFRDLQPLESHEACDISDFTWSLGYMMMATGNAQYADRIEKVIFNALPGQVTNDFKALQYFSCPNQFVSTGYSNHNIDVRGNSAMRYAPNPLIACCPANITRALPNYISRLWMEDPKGGLVAVLYGPSTVNFKGSASEITINEQTNYPFSEKITFRISVKQATELPLSFRIPEWCKNPTLFYNGKQVENVQKSGQFFILNNKLQNNDSIELYLPQEWKLANWPMNGLSIERGPVVYALNIKPQITIATDSLSSKTFPSYDMLPISHWNYAITLSADELLKTLSSQTITFKNFYPWNNENPPAVVKIPVHKVKYWKLIKTDVVYREEWAPEMKDGKLVTWKFYKNREVKGKFILTPQLPNEAMLKKNISPETDTIELIPYGCTKLRMTIFPYFNLNH